MSIDIRYVRGEETERLLSTADQCYKLVLKAEWVAAEPHPYYSMNTRVRPQHARVRGLPESACDVPALPGEGLEVIKIVYEGALCCAKFHCDTCGEPITDATMAIAGWDFEKPETIWHRHKGATCDKRTEGAWEQLDDHIRHLARNAGVKRLKPNWSPI